METNKSIEEENKNIKHKDTVLDYGDLDEEAEINERPVGGFDGKDLDEE